MNYPDALEWLFSTQFFGIKLGLESPKKLLMEFLAFPKPATKVVHVAGTNGKGSTCAMMDALSRASGHKTGLFTSPHLVDFRERIRVNGAMISEEACAVGLTKLREICESWENHPTFFEITLALGMRWFREQECEVVILETGMGGRLDATTAVPADVCVITPIGLDHTQWLGETIEEISLEKAGILVAKKPFICGKQEPKARHILEQQANALQAPMTLVEEPLLGYSLALPGAHQRENAAVAVEAIHQLGISLSYDIVQYALSYVRWIGRFDRAAEAPITIIDGAHNPHGARVLTQTWREEFDEIEPVILASAVAGKDVAGVFSEVNSWAHDWFLCPVDTPRALPTAELRVFLTSETKVREFATVADAYQQARDFARREKRPLLIFGSLFLAGEVYAILQGETFQSSTQ